MTTERLAFDGAAGRAPDPSAASSRSSNRPAEHARRLRPGEIPAGKRFQPRSGAVDFLGLEQELAGAAAPAASTGAESWLMQVQDEPALDVDAAPAYSVEPEFEVTGEPAAASEGGDEGELAAPKLYNTAWNERRAPKRRRLALPIAAGATAAVLAVAAIPWIRSSSGDGETTETTVTSARAQPRAAEQQPRAAAAPEETAAAEPELADAAPSVELASPSEPEPVERSAVELPIESGGREPVAAQAPEVEDPFAIVAGDADRSVPARESIAPAELSAAPAEPAREPALEVAAFASAASTLLVERTEPAAEVARAPAPPVVKSEPPAEAPAEPRSGRGNGSKRRARVAAVVDAEASVPAAPTAPIAQPGVEAADAAPIAEPTAPLAQPSVAAADAAPAAPAVVPNVAAPAPAVDLASALAGAAIPRSAVALAGPPLAMASEAPAHTDSGQRTSRLRIEDVLLIEGDATTLRTASANDLKGVWIETAIPFDAIGGKTKLLTPQVGKVRVKTAGGDLFEGGLYAVGESQVWLDTPHGRIALPAAKVESIAQIDVPPATVAFAASAPKQERVRVRTPGGLLYGRVVLTDDKKTTILTEDGARLTVDTALVERLTEQPRITLKRD
jgi:hypothetical protein